MTVYHGGILEIRNPDVTHSKKYLDFGKGFYVTSFPKQAERWAVRKAMRSGKGKRKNISRRKAMDIYYKSRLSEQIQAGQYGIENMDYKYLAEDLIENEPELFVD